MIERPPLLKTFELPTHEELLALEVGDHAKLIFSDEAGTFGTERMWVLIERQGDNGIQWEGTLDNEPFDMENYERGDLITFHPLDIVGTM
jgi:hypothetical protein